MVPVMTVTRRCAMIALGLALLPSVAAADCGRPADLHDGWQTAAPPQEGLDPKLICAIGPRLEKLPDADPNGIVIVRHGMLVYEHYFTAEDQRWRRSLGLVPHDASTLHDLQSITKSVVAILTGIALDRGRIKNVDAPVMSFFPQYADLRTRDKDRVTLRDLLTMTSGFDWPHSLAFARRAGAAPDPVRFVLQQPITATPGTIWSYSNIGVDLLGDIVQKAAGRPLTAFAKEALFAPLGITDWEWRQLPKGIPDSAGGLRLRPRDLVKIGQLVLNHGVWHGRRIVSAAWTRQMTAPHSPPGWLSGIADAYGYLWWLGHASLDNRDIRWVGGIGHGGQRLYVVPSLALVVVVAAGNYKFYGSDNPSGDAALDMALRAAFRH